MFYFIFASLCDLWQASPSPHISTSAEVASRRWCRQEPLAALYPDTRRCYRRNMMRTQETKERIGNPGQGGVLWESTSTYWSSKGKRKLQESMVALTEGRITSHWS
ncbi:unnamed protein product [Natator depressus]